MTVLLYWLLGVFNFILQFVGGFALIGLLVYGVYTFFATSIANGLMMIGAAVVGGWVVQIVSGVLSATSQGILMAGAKLAERKNDEDNN